MRKNKMVEKNNNISILTLDDDAIMTVTLQSYFRSVGFNVDTENDPIKAIERIRDEHYGILLLDFLMRPINGDEVVRQVREFNKEIFIILLTGHKSWLLPLKQSENWIFRDIMKKVTVLMSLKCWLSLALSQ